MNNIQMNTPTVLATQRGIKTHTRREIKLQGLTQDSIGKFWWESNKDELGRQLVDGAPLDIFIKLKAPYKVGQVLWVREPVKITGYNVQPDRNNIELNYEFSDRSTHTLFDIPERFIEVGDPRTLPKWVQKNQGIPNGCIREMARTFIKITSIHVEQLNAITEKDCLREGIERLKSGRGFYDPTLSKAFVRFGCYLDTAKEAFQIFWESINGKNSFDNRYVWVIEFERISKEEAIK